ncbi:uncharacterized protein [Rutidosis leptorrhynchoides]|uniref:uncharacterized protein n=1 Tax=Rutidosis leptorrhynchoides TaxID=125765 RepID=UPI003A99F058
MSWVKWEDTLLPFREGGLNIGSLKGKNLALLGKWFWRAKTEPNALWVKVLKNIHGVGGLNIDSGSNEIKGKRGVWANIIRADGAIDKTGIQFGSSFVKKISDGGGTCFWTDQYQCDEPLCNKFRRLYLLDTDRSCFVKD